MSIEQINELSILIVKLNIEIERYKRDLADANERFELASGGLIQATNEIGKLQEALRFVIDGYALSCKSTWEYNFDQVSKRAEDALLTAEIEK